MSRYTCQDCKSEHGTDNMVAYCASCFAAIKNQRGEAVRALAKAMKELRRARKDTERLSWLLDGRDVGIRDHDGSGLYFDTRAEIDAAMSRSRRESAK